MKQKSSPLSLAVEQNTNSKLLQEFSLNDMSQGELVEPDSADLLLRGSRIGLQLIWRNSQFGELFYTIDIDSFVNKQKSFPAPKQAGLNQALGKKTQTVIDATAGWGGDALLMCAQGLEVQLIERNAVMALLLKDAMQRLSHTSWARQHNVSIPTVIHGDAIALFNQDTKADCIYLDPMFPVKRKKSAAVNKNMRLLQSLVGADEDAVALAESAIASASGRVVVKRPDYADPLVAKPSVQFSTKLLHYDVYLRS